jgi:FkbM family methyltransferase
MLGALFYPKVNNWRSLGIPEIYNEIYFDGIYLDVMTVLDREKKNPVIVDVGANIGIVTQYLRNHGKKIYAIEPASEYFEALKKNKEFNEWDDVEIFNFAISNKDGEAELRLDQKNRTSHSLLARSVEDRVFEMVKTKKLTTFFEENKIKHVDFMKFDVEGAEDLILPSPDFVEASKIIDNIMIEFHFPNFPEHTKRLIQLGYTARRYPCAAVVLDFAK